MIIADDPDQVFRGHAVRIAKRPVVDGIGITLRCVALATTDPLLIATNGSGKNATLERSLGIGPGSAGGGTGNGNPGGDVS